MSVENDTKREIKNEKEEEKMPIKDKEEDDNEVILNSLILLYGYEKELNKLFSSSVIDEFDFKEYYIINKK